MTHQTRLIIKAARGYKTWGRDAAKRFTANNGLHPKLVMLARQLEAAK